MGSSPYFYFTPYQKDVQAALDGLREHEFKAGRYDPAMSMADPPSYMFAFKFPPDDTSPAPGARHSSIGEAIDAGAESGTRSILDIMRITSEPDYFAACALPPDELIGLFGTIKPTRELVERVLIGTESSLGVNLFWERIDRGQGRYVVVYDKSGPNELFFAGMSWD
jgi:hypothetical protein